LNVWEIKTKIFQNHIQEEHQLNSIHIGYDRYTR